MENKNFLRNNRVTIVGTIIDSKLVEKKSKDNKDMINGTFNIRVGENENSENTLTCHVICMRYNKNGEENSNYNTFKQLGNDIGKQFRATGSMSDNVWPVGGAINRRPTINIRFINPCYTHVDEFAKFNIEGFILNPLKPTVDKEGEIVKYEVRLSQAKYKTEEGVDSISLTVNKDRNDAISFFEQIEKNRTVSLSGDIVHSIVVSRVETANDFGPSTVSERHQETTDFVIDSGSVIDNEQSYLVEEIDELLRKQKQFEENLLNSNRGKQTASAINENKPTYSDRIIKSVL